ncbi:MAG: phospho-sugar mutase [Oscillospiraceae bacterium]|nr:phospho-sugar mutase [Oscillospiraceae bacterium]
MSYMAEYQKWCQSPVLNEEERAELLSIQNDEKEIESRFFAPLSFGTAGLRGVLGMGVNRMNVYTVRQATQGIADMIARQGKDAMNRGVAICMDSRIMSDVFAKEAACVLAGNGIQVYLFESLRPTPELSFAIRTISCIAGINITASHNPKEYNGYKVYWEDGAQLPPVHADVAAAAIAETDIFTGAKYMDYDKAVKKEKIILIGEKVDEAFLVHVQGESIRPELFGQVADDLKIVYTPFHGTGHKLVPEVLHRLGLKHVICVPEQMVTDGNFPTVKSPNPENPEGFALAIELAKREGSSLIIGTDPDADRVGIVVRNGAGEYVTMSGNQVGVLLLDYIIRARREAGTMPANPAALKTIVTTEMVRAVCEKNSVALFETFTGFKFLAEQIKEFETAGSHRYLLAYEESYGYLVGDFCRDKDAVTASMLIAEMSAYYHTKGMTLYEAMNALYEEYGYYGEHTENLVMPGVDGLKDMQTLMARFRETPPSEIAGNAVVRIRDYLTGEAKKTENSSIEKLGMSGSNVLYFELADGTSFIIRPSGTEPKIKVYILLKANSREEIAPRLDAYVSAARELCKI